MHLASRYGPLFYLPTANTHVSNTQLILNKSRVIIYLLCKLNQLIKSYKLQLICEDPNQFKLNQFIKSYLLCINCQSHHRNNLKRKHKMKKTSKSYKYLYRLNRSTIILIIEKITYQNRCIVEFKSEPKKLKNIITKSHISKSIGRIFN